MSEINSEIKPRCHAKYYEYIQEIDIQFSHPRVEKLKLNNLFIYPDLEVKSNYSEDVNSIINSERFLELESKIVILGEPESGKTALIKQLFVFSLRHNYLPIIIDANCFKFFEFDKCLDKIVSNTYENISYKYFINYSQRICFVDNFSSTNISERARKELLKKLDKNFDRIIILAEDIFRYDIPHYKELDEYQVLKLLPLNNVKRTQLIEKWVGLESEEDYQNNHYWQRIDTLKRHVNSLVSTTIVPAKPLYVLMFISSFEVVNTKKIELTSYGHCYQYLIYQQLERGRVKPDEIEKYFNVLSELAGTLLDGKQYTLSELELDDFFDNYSQKYLSVDRSIVINKLTEANILNNLEGGIRFRYQYSFYFFAAKNLADNLYQNIKSEEKIKYLISKIHLEGIRNIILFLTHHTKDPRILDEILYSVMELFSNNIAITLEKNSLPFLQSFASQIPDLVLENRDTRQERRREDELKDEIEKNNSSDEEPQLNIEATPEFKLFNDIRQVFGATEVCGQIFRNRMGSLDRDSLELIYEESLMSSLRLLSIFMQINDYAREQTIRKIEYFIENNPEYSNSKIVKVVETFFWDINYDLILSILTKIAHALGSNKGEDIYSKVTKNINTPAAYLIKLIIDLQFKKDLDVDNISKLYRKYIKNYIFIRMLKQIVIKHCYMHDINFKVRQRLISILKIPVDVEREIVFLKSRKSDY
ncbi:hypothetical protein Xen7305DRAFT_00013850 [Xenococcus sp. PCC 7305]|uniref:NACHT domain-containing protein n=1 Tax=Xenococcus sp. PCC 7305 TaxID=102125 RepID=UPI0002AC49A3|nr:hypothetical protein [Xenococcus sp. PCC 7305]ELS01680.1 hypothetical protein Xen7305DRAFT_00013850 [Xenococcus sp. PCC 7305]